ncbi:KpsF/GutQ family sugar-phosphate isomerase [Vogesella sp. DC21W]|uniref:KpsF/GutQ family sugar-phosphate isomerase n=1 Tax=Vogesella aquatica TaxID=2984206 RepID=A0ABT5IYT7_9NEIS|nr:KpsF/GutQ family sugar-phosphate isomerase [Vogesella aquatica]MDC7717440.1 KpsF/GutQ family sugar-phosphate isomerase [Vogesella aquatica]
MDIEQKHQQLALAREVLQIEADAIVSMAQRLGDAFLAAIDLVLACPGRVIVTGIGKSGHVGRKIAATLASTGTPSFFMHPAEAAHGDLGMVTTRDVILALSNSGESDEIIALLPALKRKGIAIIAMTGRPQSTLAQEANVHLDVAVDKEACTLGLAPTTSTTAALAMGDALAVTLLDARDFKPEDFALSHPGGSLGRRLLVHISDVMHSGDALPVVRSGASLKDALLEMTRKGLGMTAVQDADGRLAGIFTDGDLRRTLDHSLDLAGLTIDDVMGRQPRTIAANLLAAEAAKEMELRKINGLLVVDSNGTLIGALNMHDLLKAGVV